MICEGDMGFLVLVFHVICLQTFGRGSNKRSNEMWSPCCNHNSPGPNKGCDSVARVYHSGGQGSWSVEMCHVIALPPCHCPFLPALLLQQRYQRNQMGEAGGAAAPKTVVPIDACRYRRCKVLCRRKDHFDSFCPVCPNHCKFGGLKIAPAR